MLPFVEFFSFFFFIFAARAAKVSFPPWPHGLTSCRLRPGSHGAALTISVKHFTGETKTLKLYPFKFWSSQHFPDKVNNWLWGWNASESLTIESILILLMRANACCCFKQNGKLTMVVTGQRVDQFTGTWGLFYLFCFFFNYRCSHLDVSLPHNLCSSNLAAAAGFIQYLADPSSIFASCLKGEDGKKNCCTVDDYNWQSFDPPSVCWIYEAFFLAWWWATLLDTRRLLFEKFTAKMKTGSK